MDDLQELVEELVRLSIRTDEPDIACRLIEMAEEVRAICVSAADSAVYDSATIFLHTEGLHPSVGKYADDTSTGSAQRH